MEGKLGIASETNSNQLRNQKLEIMFVDIKKIYYLIDKVWLFKKCGLVWPFFSQKYPDDSVKT